MKVSINHSEYKPQLQAGDGIIGVHEIRAEVMEFAVAMEAKLRKNDHKDDWHKQPIEAHIKLLRIEMMELDVALDHLGDEAAMTECVDIANFAMIIRDKLRERIRLAKDAKGEPQ